MAELDCSEALQDRFMETVSELGLEDEWEMRRPPGRWRVLEVTQRRESGAEITKQIQRKRTINLVNLDQRQIWNGTKMLGMMKARQEMKVPMSFGAKLGNTTKLGFWGTLG